MPAKKEVLKKIMHMRKKKKLKELEKKKKKKQGTLTFYGEDQSLGFLFFLYAIYHHMHYGYT